MPLPPRPITDHDRDVLVTRNWFSRRHEGDKPAKIIAKLIAADQQSVAVSEVGGRFAGIASQNKAKRLNCRCRRRGRCTEVEAAPELILSKP
jgi:hypothetical protein